MPKKTIAYLQIFFKEGAVALLLLSFILPQSVFAAVPNDPEYVRLKSWGNIALEQAWDITRGSRDVIVAVLDSGVAIDHPDLKQNIWVNPDEAIDGLDNDGNGFVDDLTGWDFVDNDATPVPDKTKYTEIGIQHGTVVAGIIGAVGNNNQFSAGVNWQVRLLPLRILDSEGNGNTDMAVQAIDYAIKKGASVINLSLVGSVANESFRQAILRAYKKGITIVAAAGNAEEGFAGTNLNTSARYPVCFTDPGAGTPLVIGVAALDSNDRLASFSHYGSNCIDVSAPGVSLPSTLYQATDINLSDAYGGSWSGTSIAAPLVSGTVALLKALFPALLPTEIHRFITESSDSVEAANPTRFMHLGGRLNIQKALQLAIASSTPAEPTPTAPAAPSASPTSTPSQPAASLPPSATVIDPRTELIVGPQSGMKSEIRVVQASGALVHSFLAFEDTFVGGVSLASGDVDGDGVSEIIVGKGAGGSATVRIFSRNGVLKKEFLAGSATDRRGVRVAALDITKDKKVEIITVPASGDAQFITVFTAEGKEFIQFSPGERTYPFGIHMTAGMVDGRPRIVVSEQQGTSQKIEAWASVGSFVNHWTALAVSSQRPTLALGDVNSNGVADIVLGSAPGNEPFVYQRPFDFSKNQHAFLAFPSSYRGGVTVAAGDGLIIAATGKGNPGTVRIFDALGVVQKEFRPYGDFFRGGVLAVFLQ